MEPSQSILPPLTDAVYAHHAPVCTNCAPSTFLTANSTPHSAAPSLAPREQSQSILLPHKKVAQALPQFSQTVPRAHSYRTAMRRIRRRQALHRHYRRRWFWLCSGRTQSKNYSSTHRCRTSNPCPGLDKLCTEYVLYGEECAAFGGVEPFTDTVEEECSCCVLVENSKNILLPNTDVAQALHAVVCTNPNYGSNTGTSYQS